MAGACGRMKDHIELRAEERAEYTERIANTDMGNRNRTQNHQTQTSNLIHTFTKR